MKSEIKYSEVQPKMKFPLLAEDSVALGRVAIFNSESEREGVWITGVSAGMLVFNANIHNGFDILPIGATVILQQD